MNCCIQKYTTHQFTYFIYYLFQDQFKNSKIIKIQQIHQKLHTKQFFIILFATKTSSLHTILFLNKTQTKHLIALIFICVYFSL